MSTAKITRYSYNELTVEADMQSLGLVVLSDTFYPGWKAFVDGVESAIYKADYVFRAVLLDEGKHRIDFINDPASFKVGAFISFLTSVLIGILIAVDVVIQRKRKMS